ncbi:MAG: DMT family protein [Gemmatimonadota bacterium]
MAILLTLSNVFMTFAWYGHLRHTHRALWLVVLVSWGIAFFEYCFQVPANRIGYEAGVTAAQLKTLQEVITLVVFAAFATWYLREPIRWNVVVGFLLIALGAGFVFAPWARIFPASDPVAVTSPYQP